MSLLFWFDAEVLIVFLTEVDLLGFFTYYLLGYYFFGYYILGDYFLGTYFFKFTPELLSELFGGALFGGIEGWLGFWFCVGGATFGFYYFFIFFAEFIFWICYFVNYGFFS